MESSSSLWSTWLSRKMVVCLCIFMLGGGIMVEGRNPEVAALIAFKEGVTDPDNFLGSFDPSVYDPCTFTRVSCDDGVHVSAVDLVALGLSGPIAPQLGDLQYLRRLNLGQNNLNGPIPPELGNLKNLEVLVLRENNLSGNIPTALGNLQSVKLLYLQDNHLTGVVPPIVEALPNLITLNVSNNNLDAYPCC